MRPLYKRKDRYFSTLIPVSDYIGLCWQKGSLCNNSKIRTLRNCAKIDRFIKNTTEKEKLLIKEKLGIPKDNRVVIFTGRIVEAKGIRELIQAFEKLEEKNVTLLIIGSANFGAETNTSYEKDVARLIRETQKSIVFTGFVHQTELYKYYGIADIAVMPSMFEDPAPLVCIETQATGTPLIATEVGGVKEYANPEGVVLVKKNQDLIHNLSAEMTKLLVNPELRKKMGNANRIHALQFNTERYFEDFSHIMDTFGN